MRLHLLTPSLMFITDVHHRCSTPKFNTDIHHRIENGAKRCGKPFDN